MSGLTAKHDTGHFCATCGWWKYGRTGAVDFTESLERHATFECGGNVKITSGDFVGGKQMADHLEGLCKGEK